MSWVGRAGQGWDRSQQHLCLSNLSPLSQTAQYIFLFLEEEENHRQRPWRSGREVIYIAGCPIAPQDIATLSQIYFHLLQTLLELWTTIYSYTFFRTDLFWPTVRRTRQAQPIHCRKICPTLTSPPHLSHFPVPSPPAAKPYLLWWIQWKPVPIAAVSTKWLPMENSPHSQWPFCNSGSASYCCNVLWSAVQSLIGLCIMWPRQLNTSGPLI